jgi:hypothetical protein
MKYLTLAAFLAVVSFAAYAQNCTTICSDVGSQKVCNTFCR